MFIKAVNLVDKKREAEYSPPINQHEVESVIKIQKVGSC